MGLRSDHSENRYKVCAPCGRKISFGEQMSKFKITEEIETLINKYVSKKFCSLDERFSASICTSCQHALQGRERGNSKRILLSMPNYEAINLRRDTRSNPNEICDCYICTTARKTSHATISKGRGHIRKSSAIVVNPPSQVQNQFEIPETATVTSKSVMKICTKCRGEVAKGVSHPCDNGGPNTRRNIMKMIEDLPQSEQDKIAAASLRKRSRNSGSKSSKGG
ncbi:hypothetical protein QAD02_019743 [Eretmocerus hayati]|uniref:Uncharacterized protein n=1 Tax=Eretmocerus hayati TaxID=131215 RepID=A0ACC2PMA8_9HYME|nr:hypothetical protein QAD02_019743 [Eretmocerus hayati]